MVKMLKLSFVIVLVSLLLSIIIKENAAAGTGNNEPSSSSAIEKYDPFIVVTNSGEKSPSTSSSSLETPDIPTSSTHELPTKLVNVNNRWRLAAEFDYTSEIPLCPELETLNIEAAITQEILKRVFPGVDRCLFVKTFKYYFYQPKKCDQKPELSLDKRRHDDKSPVICGVNGQQQLVDAQYYSCGSEKDLILYGNKVSEVYKKGSTDAPPFEPRYLRIYEICYDFEQQKTLWTRHTPMTPELLSNPKLPYRDLSNEIILRDFSTNIGSLELNPSTFEYLKKSYEANDPTISLIHTLIPKDHMALLYWKEATTHMINSAPLSPEFIPLMKSISNGIYLASINLFEQSQRTLQIYTRAETNILTIRNFFSTTDMPLLKLAVELFGPKTPVSLFQPNIWYQFVHDEIEKSGILIVLHNTREEFLLQEICEKGERLICDFKSWSSSDELISDDILNHAYCCEISETRVKSLFSINQLKVEKVFDIQKIIDSMQTDQLGSDANQKNDPDH